MNIYFLGTGASQRNSCNRSNHPVCLVKTVGTNDFSCNLVTMRIILCGRLRIDFGQQMLPANAINLTIFIYSRRTCRSYGGNWHTILSILNKVAIPVFAHERVITNLKRRALIMCFEENRYPSAPSVAINIIKEITLYYRSQNNFPINAMRKFTSIWI
jgi:phosphoribosyl 1,2-cyclic phosphate phosphodiesterase